MTDQRWVAEVLLGTTRPDFHSDLARVLRLADAFAEQMRTRTLEPVNRLEIAGNLGHTSDFEIAAAAFFMRHRDTLRAAHLPRGVLQ